MCGVPRFWWPGGSLLVKRLKFRRSYSGLAESGVPVMTVLASKS